MINIPQTKPTSQSVGRNKGGASASKSINTRRSALPPPKIYGPTVPPAHTLASVKIWKSLVCCGDWTTCNMGAVLSFVFPRRREENLISALFQAGEGGVLGKHVGKEPQRRSEPLLRAWIPWKLGRLIANNSYRCVDRRSFMPGAAWTVH